MFSEALSETVPIQRRSFRRQWLFAMVAAACLIFFLLNFQIALVHGSSMNPSFHNGQVILVARSYWLDHPIKPGDVVLVRHDGEVLIKRVYRLGGEPVNPRRIFGAKLQRLPAMGIFYNLIYRNGPTTAYLVPKGYAVVLGDNASVSVDSRQFGPVPISSIIGRVLWAPPPLIEYRP